MTNETVLAVKECSQIVDDVIAEAKEHENSGAWVGHRVLNHIKQAFPEVFGAGTPAAAEVAQVLAA